MAFDRLPKQCFTLVEHFYFLAWIPLYDLMSQQFHISIQALSLLWTLFTRLATEWVIYVQPEFVACCWGTHEAMQGLKRFYYLKYKYECEQCRISIFRCVLPVSQGGSFSWVARNKREVFAPCHTIVQLHWEPFGTDGKDDCDSSQAEFLKTGTHSLVQDC